MGFYIHSCPKMRYKGKLTASYLLCPETYTWHLLTDEIRSKLDEQKYLRLEENAQTKDNDRFLSKHMDKVLVLVNNRTIMRYEDYKNVTYSRFLLSIIR